MLLKKSSLLVYHSSSVWFWRGGNKTLQRSREN